MFPVEKKRVGKQLSIFSKPQKFALRKGTRRQHGESPTCGAFLFSGWWVGFLSRVAGTAKCGQNVAADRQHFSPSVSIPHKRDFSQVHLQHREVLQTNCNVQFSISERRTTNPGNVQPDDSGTCIALFSNHSRRTPNIYSRGRNCPKCLTECSPEKAFSISP